MDGGAATYVYDGDGRRMKKVTPAETTYTFYGPGGIISEFTTSNTISTATAASSTDKCFYHTTDKLGSAVLVMTANGTVIENNRTLPYGEAWLSTDNGQPSTNDKKFTTYQRDQESNLDYAMGRYLVNSYGRFVSVDPGKMVFEVPSTLNRYAYTINDPINYNDPDGRFLGFIGSFGNWVGRVLGFVQAVAPLAASAANGFQSTQVKPDKNWELNRLALIAAWGAAIAAQENEPGQPYKLVVESDCYLKGGSASVGGLFNPGVARRRTYAVEDIKGNLIRGVTVQETNHVYGTNGLNSGNAYFSTGVLATFQDNIWTNAVVNQDQEFHIGDRKLIIEEKDGTQHGTLGIYSDRNVVIINGDDGRDAKGNLKYCP
jgi:RHS repeat-associated protein